MVALVLLLLGIGLDWLAIPPGPLPIAILAADVPFLILIGGRVTKRWRLWAFVYGYVHFAVALRWLAEIHWIQVLGASFILAFVYLLAAMVIRALTKRGAPYLLVVPTVLVLEEISRTWWFGGMPWPARSLSFASTLAPAAAYLGAYAFTFTAAFTSAVLVRPKLLLPARVGLVLVPIAVLVLLGHLRTGAVEAELEARAGEPARPVIAVQANIPQSLKHSGESGADMRMYGAHLDLTRQALAEAKREGEQPAAVLWPETMIPWVFASTELQHRFPDTWENELRVWSHIRRVSTQAPDDAPFLLGAVYHYRRGDERHGRLGRYGTHDSLFFVDAKRIPFVVGKDPAPPPPLGTTAPWIRARHDKRVLVPGGEYTPLGEWIPPLRRFRDLVSVIPPLDPGLDAQVPYPLEAASRPGGPSIRLGTVICFELLFPARCRAWRDRGATVLLNPANYGWFGESGFRAQIAAAAALRAVETGTTVVMAGNTGPTGFWDPLGRRQGRFVPEDGGRVEPTGAVPTTFRRGWASGHLDATSTVPLYMRIGDVPWYVLGVLSVAVAVLARRRTERRRKPLTRS